MDEWCDLCRDKLKSVKVELNGRVCWICNHCKSLCPEAKVKKTEGTK